LTTLVLDRFGPGGQAGTSSRIENYMGFPAGLTGAELANRGYLQALKFGAELVAPVEVRSMTCEDRVHRLVLDDGQVVRARTVLISTGASYQRLPIAGCERWTGRGSSTPVPRCTRARARAPRRRRGGRQLGRPGGDLPCRPHRRGLPPVARGDIRKSMSEYLARRIERHEKIEVIRNTQVDAIQGNGVLTGIRLRDVQEGGTRDLACAAIFVFIGAQPRTDWLPESIAVDSKGFILTGADAAKSGKWPLENREPCTVETTCPESSPPATFAVTRPNGSRSPSATGRWR